MALSVTEIEENPSRIRFGMKNGPSAIPRTRTKRAKRRQYPKSPVRFARTLLEFSSPVKYFFGALVHDNRGTNPC